MSDCQVMTSLESSVLILHAGMAVNRVGWGRGALCMMDGGGGGGDGKGGGVGSINGLAERIIEDQPWCNCMHELPCKVIPFLSDDYNLF